MLYSTVQQLKQTKFNNSNQYATTSFVQDALGNYSSVVSISTSTYTVTSAQSGVNFLVTAESSVTLPSANSVISGSCITFTNIAKLTVGISGSVSFNVGNTTKTSLVVSSGNETTFVSNGTTWSAFGTGTLSYSSDFTSVLAASAGSYKLPGGFYLKWSTVAAIPAGSSGTVSWDSPFPTAAFAAWATPIGSGTNSNASGFGIAWTTIGVTVYNWGVISFGAGVKVYAIGN